MLKKPIAILLIVILSVLSLTSVSFADADTVTILTQRASDETASSSSYIKPPKGIMTKMTYNAQLNGTNAEASLFSWSVSPENKGVFVDNTGTVYVSGDTTISSFDLTASLKSNPLSLATNTIILEETVLYDFDNNTFSNVTPAVEAGGNKYMQGGTNSDSYVRANPKAFDSGYGSATFSYDIKIGDSCTTKYMWADTRYWSMYVYLNQSNRCPEIPAGYGSSTATVIGGAFPVDEWTNIKFEFDFASGKYATKVGDTVTGNLSHKSGKGFKIAAMGFSYKVDNIRIYSGHEVERTVEVTAPRALSIPASGETSSKLYADVSAGSLKINEEIKWELADSYPGVSISGDVITVSAGAPLAVDIKASLKSSPAVFDVYTLTLVDETNLEFSDNTSMSEITGTTEILTDSSSNKYLKTEGTSYIAINPSMQSGTVLVVEADIHSLNENLSTLAISDDIEFKINKSEGKIYEDAKQNTAIEVGSGFTFTFIFNDINKTYMAFADSKLISSGSSLAITPESFKFDTNLSRLYIGSARQKAPYVTKREINGTPISGKEIKADAEFISENGDNITSNQISWYVDGSFVSNGLSFTVPENSEGKEIYYTISASNAYGTTNDVISKKQNVKKFFEAQYLSDAVSIWVNNIWDTSKDVIAYLSLYNTDKCVNILARKISVDVPFSSDAISVPSSQPFDRIDVILTDAQNHAPLSTPFTVYGSAQTINGQLAAVYMLNPSDTSDVLSKFQSSYNMSNLEAAVDSAGDSISSVLCNICILKPKADGTVDYPYTPEVSGLYNVVVVKEDGTAVVSDKYINPSEILTLNGASNLSDIRVEPVVKALTGREDIVINSAIDVYSSVADKSNVIKLANGDINSVIASIYLAKSAEDAKANTSTINSVKSELGLLGKDTLAIELLCKNASYTEPVQKAISSGFTNIDTYLANLKTASILCGVKNVVNDKDAKIFLQHISNQKYNQADETGKNKIANAVYGKTYSSIGELSSAVNAVTLTPDINNNQQGSKPVNNNQSVFAGSFSDISPSPSNKTETTPKYVYTDVSDSHWAFNSILYLSQKGIVNGYEGSFYPDKFVTRAEFVKMLCTAFSLEAATGDLFEDVSENDWFAPYVSAAKEAALVSGDGKYFNPNSQITRQDAAVMVYRFANYSGINLSGKGTDFADDTEISDYAKEAVYAMNFSGIINGMGNGIFAPRNTATRAQAAQMIFKMLEKGGK